MWARDGGGGGKVAEHTRVPQGGRGSRESSGPQLGARALDGVLGLGVFGVLCWEMDTRRGLQALEDGGLALGDDLGHGRPAKLHRRLRHRHGGGLGQANSRGPEQRRELRSPDASQWVRAL